MIWCSATGGGICRAQSAGGWFAARGETAGVQAITPHDLRHTCASLAMSAGVNVLALQRMLGHKSAKVTLDTYATCSTPTWTRWPPPWTWHGRRMSETLTKSSQTNSNS